MSSTVPPLSAVLPAESPALDSRKGWLAFCLFALYVIWGSTYLAIHWALQGGFPPLLLGGLRFTLAGALLFTALRLKGEPTPGLRQWGAGAFTGLLLLTMGNGCISFAQQWVPSGVVALISGSVPLWAALFGGLYDRQWPGRAERWGLALGFFGIAVLNKGGELGEHWGAVLALLAAPVAWAFGSVWGRRSPSMPRGLMGTATQMLCAGVMLVALSLSLGERLPGVPEPRAVASFFYLVGFGSLIAFSAYGYLLRHARPAVATSYAYVNPAVAMVLGMGLGGETPGPYAFVAMAAILAAVVLITRKAAGRSHDEADEPASENPTA
ncbi:MAG: drug/metabolite exporter YedA [Hyalangium sp.]|uniref:drug/metabolite exporter YedA n=1 Tax=Hyalangium sp. TaxID=2028555 RepID=UPI00389A2415